MMDATRRWLRRNRTTFAVGAGVVGVGYIAGQYVLSKIGEARERMISERVAKENLRRRFQQNQEDCTITVLELLPTITENVLAAQPSEKITQELQMKKAQRLGKAAGTSDFAPSEPSISTRSALDDDRASLSSESYIHASMAASSSSGGEDSKSDKSKAQLWHDLKISSLTRAFTLIYMVSLLSLLTRIQLNLLGRRSYLASIIAQTSMNSQSQPINLEDRVQDSHRSSNGDEFETNRQYLTFSWWLLHKGWRDIMTRVSSAVTEVFGPVKPTADVQADQLSSLVLEVRKRVEGISAEDRGNRSWLQILLPPQDEETRVLRDSGMLSSSRSNLEESNGSSPASDFIFTPSLRHLLDETADIIESPSFHNVLTSLLDSSFSRLVDVRIRADVYKSTPIKQSTEPQTGDKVAEESFQRPVKLASILAVVTKEAHQIGHGPSNEYVQTLENVEDLDAFSAVVYSSNFETDHEQIRSSQDYPFDDGYLLEKTDQPLQEAQPTMIDKAANLADTAWSGFESVWAKITG